MRSIPITAVDTVLFTIYSAIKLSSNIQKAYANSLRSNRLVLPLPRFDQSITETTIEDFFNDERRGRPFLESIEHLRVIHEKAQNGNLMGPEMKEYEGYYRAAFSVLHGEVDEIYPAELGAMLKIRQWETNKAPTRTALELMAGTFVEIGVDYFATVPGSLNQNSSYGQVLKGFFQAIDDIEFTGPNDLKRVITKKVAPRLFASAAEALGTLGKEISPNIKLQSFISSATKGLADDIYKRIEQLETSGNPDEIVEWGQMVLHSMVKNSGNYIFSTPAQVFGVSDSQAKLIESTGSTLMSLILDPSSTQLNFKKIFNPDSIDKVMHSALSVVAEYPELISRKQGLKEIIAKTSASLAESTVFRPDLFPELLRLVLQNTSENLYLLWDVDSDKPKHVLVTALQSLLGALASTPDGGKWRFQLSNSQILDIANSVVDEVSKNPSWIESKSNEPSVLSDVLGACVKSVAAIPGNQRFRPQTLETLVQMSMRAVAANKRVLNKIKWSANEQETTILNKSLDLVFGYLFHGDNLQGVQKLSLVNDLLEYVFDTVLLEHPDEKGLALIDLILFEKNGLDFSKGFSPYMANQLIESALQAIAEHPELISNKQALKDIVGGVAAGLKDAGWQKPAMLQELVRLTLEKTAGHLETLTAPSNSQNLLVHSLSQTLKSLSTPPTSGKWKPQLTDKHIFGIVNTVFDAVVSNPKWVREDGLIVKVLTAAFDSLEVIAQSKKPAFEVVNTLIRASLEAVGNRKTLLAEIETHDGKKQIYLTYSMQSLMLNLYDDQGESEGTWTLTQDSNIHALIESFLASLSQQAPSLMVADAANTEVKNAIQQINDNLSFTIGDLLAKLQSTNA